MSKTTIKQGVDRAWSDIDPKLTAWIAGGGILTAASYVATTFGWHLPVWEPTAATSIAAIIVFYLKKSSIVVGKGDDSAQVPPVTLPALAVVPDDAPDLTTPSPAVVTENAPAKADGTPAI